jgi:hypothetical protein
MGVLSSYAQSGMDRGLAGRYFFGRGRFGGGFSDWLGDPGGGKFGGCFAISPAPA